MAFSRAELRRGLTKGMVGGPGSALLRQKWESGGGVGGGVRPGNWSALVCLEREAWKQIVVSWEPRLSWTGEGLESQRLQG